MRFWSWLFKYPESPRKPGVLHIGPPCNIEHMPKRDYTVEEALDHLRIASGDRSN